jgi:hypothetical protein
MTTVALFAWSRDSRDYHLALLSGSVSDGLGIGDRRPLKSFTNFSNMNSHSALSVKHALRFRLNR